MRTWSVWFPITVAVSLAVGASAQQPAAPQAAPVERRDPALDAATRLIGRALILRCFCAENSLAFDAAGQLEQTVKLTDWTLAGVNVLKVERKAAGTIELDGLRVAVRFAPDRREFDRHAMNDEKVKILVADDGTAAGFAHTLEQVFSDGLDLRLQRAMPAYWLHYFMPKTPWPKDGLEGETIVMPGAPGAPAGLTDPRPIKRSEPTYTTEASHDRVLGTVMVQAVVDAQGEPQRPVIVQPLGYGLDARTVQAVERFHFQPASAGGKSVAAYVEIRQEFTAAP
jgi:TonB family protein